ncbi:M1 family metallopeptidase [Chitinophaga rhizophila]|uniref:Aminopeptidase N n=1 Tax=Chitinophaga rhizophila TaxID=2866212 RepID=A0ABS7GIQ3_9BACT|nr:M1 family metallopeptidase [Chitinophaga rhizophila]MBW8687582.1 M1 family metallopeptidase [Chitinophaga rhizophila]
MNLYNKLIPAFLLILSTSITTTAQNLQADVQHYDISLTLSDSTDKISAVTGITVRFKEDARELCLDLVGRSGRDTGMAVSMVTEGKKPVAFRQQRESVRLQIRAKKGETHTYRIAYSGIPANGLIISTNMYGKRTFFTDNWPNRAHYWLPSIDHPSDKAAVDYTIIAPDHYNVVANGLKTEETNLPGRLKRTRYQEKVVLPTKVFAVGVADFAIDHPGDVKGIPVYTYVYPQNKARGFQDYAKAVEVLDFFIGKLGPYAYKKLANVQSKTMFGGMENAGAIFYEEESVGARTIEPLIAHEIAHQWFGDAVTETGWEHVWLSEGFATYMTHVYMEHKYGADTLAAGMKADRRKIIAFNKRRHTPVVDTSRQGGYMQLLNANSYEKGGWVLHMLRRQVGDSLFWKGIRSYFAAYNGRNANTDNFRQAMEQASGQELTAFFQQWLHTPGVPVLAVRKGNDPHTMVVEQLQETLFSFPLEYKADNNPEIQRILIKDRVTMLSIPGAELIHIDPRTNLLIEDRFE